MKAAFTFPGQGSQQVGMGKALADASPAAAAVFAEVDDALGEKLSSVIFEGPEDQLTLTANTQPALMAVSIAAARAMAENGFAVSDKAAFVAGHSLGEYSALCAAGSISLSDTARLLRIRGNAMQAAVPVGMGAMAAIIGLEHDVVTAICEAAKGSGTCQIANDNGGGQLVISGSKAEVEAASEMAKEKGAKRALLLPVSAPFHSAMMAPAADAMAEALADVEISAPCVPLIANIHAGPISDPGQIRESLVAQVTSQVRWNESIIWLGENGVDTLIEIGSGKVLSGLAKRINREMRTVAVGNPGDIDALSESLS